MRIKFSAVCAVIIAVQTALGFLWATPSAYAAETVQMEAECSDIIDSVFDYLTGERGGFFEGLEFGQSDWAAYCAARLGGEYAQGASEYVGNVQNAVAELMGQGFVPPTELQRAAVALSGFSECPKELIYAAAYDNADLDRQGLNAWIWALTAANSSGTEAESGALNTRQSLAEHIISSALPDGGFNLRGEGADCDMTAAAIYALAPLDEVPAVKEALAEAVECLAALQLENGGFRSMGIENCESAAQAIIAFTAVGYDIGDSRVSRALSAMLKYRTEGGFAHTLGGGVNGSASVQALQAITALRLRGRGERLFDACGFLVGDNETHSADSPTEKEELSSDTAMTESVGSAEILSPKAAEMGGFTITLIISACLALAGVALAAAGIFKRNKSSLAVAAVLFAAAGGVWLLDIRSPSEYYSQKYEGDMRVTVGADCSAVLAAMDKIDADINPASVIPVDGAVIAECEIYAEEGATAFEALITAARGQRVAVDYIGSIYGVYVRGIGHIYEFGFGDMSGWIYKVNGESPDVSAGEFVLSEGDRVEFIYTIG